MSSNAYAVHYEQGRQIKTNNHNTIQQDELCLQESKETSQKRWHLNSGLFGCEMGASKCKLYINSICEITGEEEEFSKLN